MQVVLAMFRADGERRSFSVVRDMTVVGRREDCDLRIPLGEVSRKHCRFIKDGDAIRLEDLGSSNGTYHNGQRIQEAVLAPGDTVQVGPVSFVVQIDGVPADEELLPPAPSLTGSENMEDITELVAEPASLDDDAPSEVEPLAELEPVTEDQEGAADESAAIDELTAEEPVDLEALTDEETSESDTGTDPLAEPEAVAEVEPSAEAPAEEADFELTLDEVEETTESDHIDMESHHDQKA